MSTLNMHCHVICDEHDQKIPYNQYNKTSPKYSNRPVCARFSSANNYLSGNEDLAI